MNTNKIREALEDAYQHFVAMWQMASGPLTRADADMKINRNRDALAELDKAPKALTDKPVAWMSDDGEPISAKRHEDMEHAEHPLLVHYTTPLYLAPAAGLTVEEVDQCMDEVGDPPDNPDHFWQWREKVSARLTAAIEAKTRKP